MKGLGFGMHSLEFPARSMTLINVLQRSPSMTRLALCEGPQVEFEANGRTTLATFLPMTSTQGGKFL
jgi:hypothetical protein